MRIILDQESNQRSKSIKVVWAIRELKFLQGSYFVADTAKDLTIAGHVLIWEARPA